MFSMLFLKDSDDKSSSLDPMADLRGFLCSTIILHFYNGFMFASSLAFSGFMQLTRPERVSKLQYSSYFRRLKMEN